MAKSAVDQLYEYLSEVKRPWLFLVWVFSVFLVAGAIVLSAVWFLTRR
jgi:ABC-type multidrug transport system permease subunit